MKKNQVKIGGLYGAKVSDKLVTVRIDSAHSGGGWNATNTATGKRIRIKSAQRLGGPAQGTTEAGGSDAKPASGETPATKKAKASGPAAPKSDANKPAGEVKAKRVSALDAAAQVLAKAGKPMRAQELVTAMAEQGLWKSPAGKTPHATLYAAIMREARDKGREARFKKVDRGMFAFAGKGA
jgi:hypothetical protein